MHSIRTDNSATTRPFKERYTFIPKVRILEIGSMKILKTGKNSEFRSRLYKSSKISHCLFWAEVNYNDSRIDNSTLFQKSLKWFPGQGTLNDKNFGYCCSAICASLVSTYNTATTTQLLLLKWLSKKGWIINSRIVITDPIPKKTVRYFRAFV